MTTAPTSKSAAIRARLNHPVIDCDGHTVELDPAFLDHLKEVAGADVCSRYLRRRAQGGWLRWYQMSRAERHDQRAIRPPWWRVPTANTLDWATFVLPKLRYERMQEMGFDFAVLYPTYGLAFPHIADEELRRACCRAHNACQSEMFGAFRDRLSPAALIPMNTPQEAVEELEYAVKELGLKCVMLAGHVMRPVAAVARKCPGARHDAVWLDTYGLDSEYDYDAVWAKCAELKVAPTFHSAGMAWGSRTSISNYMYNHLGHFAAAGEALCKSLIMGGVVRRFPHLRFAFLEGGVAWACSLLSDMVAHWEKRNRNVIERCNPVHLDRAQLQDICRLYGDPSVAGRWEQLAGIMEQVERAQNEPRALDDWATAAVERGEDIRDLFVRNLFFGCEADDHLNALAFNTNLNPFGARLNAVFSSDVGHWDVQDITAVVAEAFELVEKGLITEEDFQDLVFTNPVKLLTGVNPEFFQGTAIETEAVRLLLQEASTGQA